MSHLDSGFAVCDISFDYAGRGFNYSALPGYVSCEGGSQILNGGSEMDDEDQDVATRLDVDCMRKASEIEELSWVELGNIGGGFHICHMPRIDK